MLSYRPSGISGSRFLISAIVAFGIVSASAAKAQSPAPQGTTWVVTVDVTQPNANGSWEIPNYSVKSNPPDASNCGTSSQINSSKGDVGICAGDTVYWSAKTTKGNGFITVYEWDGVLRKSANDPSSPRWFQGAANTDIGGITVSTHPQTGAHGYAISVYDPDSSHPQPVLDDPQIVIGSGTPYDLIENMHKDCGDLSKLLDRDLNGRKQVDKVCGQILDLKKVFRLP